MPHTLINKKASNWVDRGEPPYPTIERVLGRFLDRNPADASTWFREQAVIVVGMVEADASEVHVAAFLRTLLVEPAPVRDANAIRAAAIAVWHIAKASLVRDLAERIFRGDVPEREGTPDRLSHWLASRLLSAEQLAAFEQNASDHTPMTQRPVPPNRSIPESIVMPVLVYPDVRAAVAWLNTAFGCVERLRIGTHRAQLALGGGHLVATDGPSSGAARSMVLVRVADVDAHCRRAERAGARIVAPPADHAYGERQYTAEDIAGHRWTFSQTIADVDPASWGGVLVE